MQLVLERCTIRPWRLDDAESLARHANNRKIWLAVRDLFPHPYTIRRRTRILAANHQANAGMKFCIEIDGAAVGGIGVHPGQDVHRHTATLGYWLGEEFWGRGIMTEAVGPRSLISVSTIFRSAESLRRSFANNPASARVLEKAGFSFRRTPQEQRGEGRTSSRFTALRPDKVAPCEPATCVSVDHRRYGSPQQSNDFIYRSRVQRRARTFGYPGCDSGGRVLARHSRTRSSSLMMRQRTRRRRSRRRQARR